MPSMTLTLEDTMDLPRFIRFCEDAGLHLGHIPDTAEHGPAPTDYCPVIPGKPFDHRETDNIDWSVVQGDLIVWVAYAIVGNQFKVYGAYNPNPCPPRPWFMGSLAMDPLDALNRVTA